MKRISVISLAVFVIVFATTSCGSKTKNTQSNNTNEKSATSENSAIQISEIHFDNNWNKLSSIHSQLSEEEYNTLNLGELSFMANYGELQFNIGEMLIDEEHRQLLTIKTISSGEIAEYLLGYLNNTVTDSLLVAYEDNVEYYSITSSVINDDKITVTTINFDYSGLEGSADTIVNSYRITPELTFDEIIEE